MTTSVELTRIAKFQWNSRVRGTERPLRKCAAETSAARDLRTSHQGTESCNKRTQRRSCNKRTQRRSCNKRTQRRSCNKRTQRRPARSETSGASHWTSRVPAGPRDKRAQERAKSDKPYISGDQHGARPVARAAGRAEHQPVRVTSVLKKGPRATSAGLAETSRRSETSGASCRMSQEPAVPRDKHAQERT
jgi:hypothetical protein